MTRAAMPRPSSGPGQRAWVGRLRRASLLVVLASAACGGVAEDTSIGKAKPPVLSATSGDEWPLPAVSPADAVTVKTALGSLDGAQLHVRAYLAAVTVPCPACNVPRAAPRGSSAAGASPRGTPPGCPPCPPPAVTISDDPPGSAGPRSAPLRATGGAEGLQPRHVGQLFLLSGTLHLSTEQGPELEVTDVRVLRP